MHLIETIQKPLIIAHRGVSAHAPENTMAAFKLALEHHADGFELDAKCSADGQVMVIHDHTVDRTTGGQGKVRDLTLSQHKALDAGSHFSPDFAGEPIPTLDEVFEELGHKTLINVELTNYASPADNLTDLVADLVIRHGVQDNIFFSSFHPVNLVRIRRRLPEAPVAILTLPGPQGWLLRGTLGHWAAPQIIHPYYKDVDEAFIVREHQQGRNVNVWTVNDPNEMKHLFKLGIDGIITDDPRLARQVLEEK
jgi:glycerophosphoryl diester phosphodiesterase